MFDVSAMHPHDKLFIPGPVEVSEKTWAAFSRPMIGHRGEDFKNLYRAIHPGLQRLFGTKQPVFLSTSSAWGVMEASIRNLVDRGVLCCMCGAFSDKWFDVAKRCGKNAEPLQVEWGKHIDPEGCRSTVGDRQIRHRHIDPQRNLDRRDESARGNLQRSGQVSRRRAHRRYGLVILRREDRDGRARHRRDAHRRAKGAGFPPGFSLFSVSEKAFARAEKIPNRGFYFDFLEFKKQQAEWMTPSTPSIAHIHALQFKLDEIFEEGLEARFARHARTNALVHDWVRRAGFDFFAEEGFRSKTLTCVKNNKGIDVLEFAKKLREKHHLVIDPGYGKIRGKTFRLSNMGDETEETVSHLLTCLDDIL